MNESCFLFVPDVPQGLEFGIDSISYEVGPKFKGLSMIPKGIHFVYHNVGFGMKQGFFIEATPGDILICPWLHDTEEISPTHELSDSSILTLKSNIMSGSLNEQLGPYPFSQHHNWINLSSFISKSTLTRAHCDIFKIIYGESCAEVSNANINNTILEFVDINRAESIVNEKANNKPNRSELLTKLNMDKSDLILYLVQHEFQNSWQELIGEFQLSFILFVTLYSLPALNQWKKMFDILCKCEKILRNTSFESLLESSLEVLPSSSINNQTIFKSSKSKSKSKSKSHHNMTVSILRIIYEQLSYAPMDFFEDELSKENFLVPALTNLFISLDTRPSITNISSNNALMNNQQIVSVNLNNSNNTDENNIDPHIFEHKRRLLTFVQKRFHIFEDNQSSSLSFAESRLLSGLTQELYDDDDMPVVVGEEELLSYHPSDSSATTDSDCHINCTSSSDNVTSGDSNHQMSSLKLQELMYSWRYPLVHEQMLIATSQEDYLMTATRLVDEYYSGLDSNEGNAPIGADREKLFKEALIFIEHEVSHLNYDKIL